MSEELLIDQPLTVEQFLDMYQHIETKFELVDGRPVAMSSGTILHSRIAVNILTTLSIKLRGSGCRPFNSDPGLKVNEATLQYPDVAITATIGILGRMKPKRANIGIRVSSSKWCRHRRTKSIAL